LGCGCRKPANRNVSSKRRELLKIKSAKVLKDKRKLEKAVKLRDKFIQARLNICKSCPHSVQNKRDKKYNIRICHKINRPLSVVSSDLSFSCPIGSFKSAG